MAKITPLRGILYNPEMIGDLARVMAPPYDVISPDLQDTLYKRHPYNMVRLIQGKVYPDDRPGRDRYTRASEWFRRWQEEGVLVRDKRPSLYYYTQTYRLEWGYENNLPSPPFSKGGKGGFQGERTRRGFIALVRLEDFTSGVVIPHERTLFGPKRDRLILLEATRANLCPVFSLYPEPQKTINNLLEENTPGPPLYEVTDDERVINRLWRVTNAKVIKRVVDGMADKPLFIADGHHRYETALRFRDIMRERVKGFTGEEVFNYVMMYLCNMDDEGIEILPTHRVIHGIPGFIPRAFLVNCSHFFDIEEIRFDITTEPGIRKAFYRRVEERGRETNAFGLFIRGLDSYFVLTLKDRDVMGNVFGDTIPEVYRSLDVTILHSLILQRLLGIDHQAQERETNIIYVRGRDEALELVRKEERQLAFILNPTRMEEIKAVALSGHVMPQKSTYFYPKPLTGLVINPIIEGEMVGPFQEP